MEPVACEFWAVHIAVDGRYVVGLSTCIVVGLFLFSFYPLPHTHASR